MLNLTTLFVKIDDFYQIFQPSYVKHLRNHHLIQYQRKEKVPQSEAQGDCKDRQDLGG